MILFLNADLKIISFPIEDFTSFTWEECWTEPGAWSITLHPQEFDVLKDAAYIYYDVCGWGVVESIENTRDSFKLGGRELSAILDNYVVSAKSDVNDRAEAIARNLVSAYSNVGLGLDNSFGQTVSMTIERGSLLTSLYNLLNPKGLSFKVSIDTGISQRIVKGIAHRGESYVAPENTIPAFELAATDGFGYIETDIAYTSDGYAVCLHDSTIDRTSNGTGAIASMTLATAQTYDFGSWKDASYAGTKIPTWGQCLDTCKASQVDIYCELKTNRGLTEQRVKDLIDLAETKEVNVTWISFYPSILEWVTSYRPEARIGLLVNSTTQIELDIVKGLKLPNNDAFIISSSWSDAEAELAKANNVPFEVCVIDNETTMRSTHPYTTGILSNRYSAETVFASSGEPGFVFDVIRGENRTSYQTSNRINSLMRQSSAEYVVVGQTAAASTAQRTFLRAGAYRVYVKTSVGSRLGARRASTGGTVYMTNEYATDYTYDLYLPNDDSFAFWLYRASADGGILVSDVISVEVIPLGVEWAILSENRGNIVGSKYTKNSRDYKNYVIVNVGDDENPDILEYDFRDVL